MKCVGKSAAGNLRVCACFMRQFKGCDDGAMKSGKNVRENFVAIIQKIDWDKTTICQGYNEHSEDGRVCLCLGEQRQKSCDPKMRIVSLTKAELLMDIEGLNC